MDGIHVGACAADSVEKQLVEIHATDVAAANSSLHAAAWRERERVGAAPHLSIPTRAGKPKFDCQFATNLPTLHPTYGGDSALFVSVLTQL